MNINKHSVALSYLWIISFSFSLPIVEPHSLSRLASIIACSLAIFISTGFLLSSSNKITTIKIQPIPAVLILFTLLAGSSLIWTSALNVSTIWLLSFLLFPAFFLCFLCLDLSANFYRVTTLGLSTIIGALSLWVIIQYLFFPELMIKGRIRYPFANPNSYAALLMLAFFPLLGLSFIHNNKTRLLLKILCAIILISIILLAGRSVLIILFTFLVPCLFFIREAVVKEIKYVIILILCIFLGFLGPNIIPQSNHIETTERFVKAMEQPQRSIKTRTSIWTGTINIIKGDPILGKGFGTFYLHYPEHRDKEEVFSAGFMAHNDPLQFWVEIGFLGPILFYTLCTLCIYYTYKTIRVTQHNQMERILPITLFCGLGSIAVHSHVSFDLYIVSILCLMSLVFVLWYKETNRLINISPLITLNKKGISSSNAYGIAFIPALIIMFFAQGFLLSEYYLKIAKNMAQKNDEQGMLEAINKAHNTAFGLNPKAYILAASLYVHLLESTDIYLTKEERKIKYKAALELLNKAERLNKRLVDIYYYKGRLYQEMGNEKEYLAELSHRKAIEKNPRYLPSRIELASLYIKNGNKEKGYNILKDGMNWRYTSKDSKKFYNLIILLSLELDDVNIYEKAKKRLKKAY